MLEGGSFLQGELIPISLTDKYRGTALRKFTKGKKKYAEMSFQGYDKSWNENILL